MKNKLPRLFVQILGYDLEDVIAGPEEKWEAQEEALGVQLTSMICRFFCV